MVAGSTALASGVLVALSFLNSLFIAWAIESADEKSGQFPRQFSQKKKVFREPQSVLNFYLAAVGIPLAQYVAKTGDRTLLSRQVWKTADWLVANLIDPKSGALRTPGKALGHHADELGGVKGLLSNDDGVIISLLCLDRMRPKTSWREAAFKNAEWWLGLKEQPKLFAAIPATMLLMLDMARLTGKVEYLDWVLERLEGVLALQDWGKNPMSRGAFLGEDGNRMPNWLGAPPEQCTCLRLTSYVTIALSKLIASEKTWSPAYSCFGW